MRPLLEVGAIIVLIAFGWKQSYRDQWARITGRPTTEELRQDARRSGPHGAPAGPARAQPSDNRWMWEKSKLDR